LPFQSPKIVFFTLLLITTLLFSCGEIKSEPKHFNSARQDSLSIFFKGFADSVQKQIDARMLPGAAIVIVQDTSILFMHGFGLRNAATSDSINSQTLFRLGSVSKGFASLLTGIMVDSGLIKWSDRVIDHLPNFKLNDSLQTDSLEIRHLLSHTTGLPRHAYTNLIEDGLSLERITGLLQRVELISKPGEQFAYQNAAFEIGRASCRERV